MLHIEFEYRDKWTKGKWSRQTCEVESVEMAKKIYGLGTDPECEYHIVKIEERVKENRPAYSV